MKNVKFEIVERIGVIRPGDYPIELNHVRWNEGNAVFDLRRWKVGEDGTKAPLKGVTLNKDELRTLRDILNGMEVLKDE